MRQWIDLVEHQSMPQVLYHGTMFENLIGIFRHGRIIHRPGVDQGHDGVSFTSDIDVAKAFAHVDAHDSGILYGEILTDHEPNLTGAVIASEPSRLGRLEQYDDGTGDHLEAEWRTFGDVPVSAISWIAISHFEAEQYRKDYLEARETFDISEREHMAQEWKDGITAYLADDNVLAAIDAILASPLVRPWERLDA